MTERIATLDIGSLPEIPTCRSIFLAAKQFVNLDELTKIRIKFPKIELILIYTSSIQDRQLISQLREKIGVQILKVKDISMLRQDLLTWYRLSNN